MQFSCRWNWRKSCRDRFSCRSLDQKNAMIAHCQKTDDTWSVHTSCSVVWLIWALYCLSSTLRLFLFIDWWLFAHSEQLVDKPFLLTRGEAMDAKSRRTYQYFKLWQSLWNCEIAVSDSAVAFNCKYNQNVTAASVVALLMNHCKETSTHCSYWWMCVQNQYISLIYRNDSLLLASWFTSFIRSSTHSSVSQIRPGLSSAQGASNGPKRRVLVSSNLELELYFQVGWKGHRHEIYWARQLAPVTANSSVRTPIIPLNWDRHCRWTQWHAR